MITTTTIIIIIKQMFKKWRDKMSVFRAALRTANLFLDLFCFYPVIIFK